MSWVESSKGQNKGAGNGQNDYAVLTETVALGAGLAQ